MWLFRTKPTEDLGRTSVTKDIEEEEAILREALKQQLIEAGFEEAKTIGDMSRKNSADVKVGTQRDEEDEIEELTAQQLIKEHMEAMGFGQEELGKLGNNKWQDERMISMIQKPEDIEKSSARTSFTNIRKTKTVEINNNNSKKVNNPLPLARSCHLLSTDSFSNMRSASSIQLGRCSPGQLEEEERKEQDAYKRLISEHMQASGFHNDGKGFGNQTWCNNSVDSFECTCDSKSNVSNVSSISCSSCSSTSSIPDDLSKSNLDFTVRVLNPLPQLENMKKYEQKKSLLSNDSVDQLPLLSNVEDGLTSKNFNLKLNIVVGDVRELEGGKAEEIKQIMQTQSLDFDDARLLSFQKAMAEAGVDLTGLPSDPKAFSWENHRHQKRISQSQKN